MFPDSGTLICGKTPCAINWWGAALSTHPDRTVRHISWVAKQSCAPSLGILENGQSCNPYVEQRVGGQPETNIRIAGQGRVTVCNCASWMLKLTPQTLCRCCGLHYIPARLQSFVSFRAQANPSQRFLHHFPCWTPEYSPHQQLEAQSYGI